MNFEFSEEQNFIREQAAKFLAEQCTPDRVRDAMANDDGYDKALWQQIVDLGWPALAIPEAQGGLGLGYLELCVIAEELGRAAAPVPFSSSVYLATEALRLAADDSLQEQWLPRLATGEVRGCLAAYEGPGRLKVSASATGGTLSGEKWPVLDGDTADFAIVAAQDEYGATRLFLAELNAPGVSRTPLQTMDPSRGQAKLVFQETPVTPLSSDDADSAAQLQRLLDGAAVLLAFEQIGGAQAALDMGMAYTKDRYAFGRPVASFQAIKHKFADMYVALELARSNGFYGAWALSTDAADLPLAAATARVSATDAFYQASKENIQAHGGMGFTWEFNCHLHYRRAQLLSMVIGGQPEWKDKVAERLLQAA